MRSRFVVAAALFAAGVSAQAQGPGGAAQPQRTPKAQAPIDLTGYWVSIVTEDWRFRMVTPPKGDYASVPLNAEGRRVADTWDPAKDEASGNVCKAYGVPGLIRVPGRLHVTWDSDTAIKVETDAGMQTRMLRFGAAPAAGSPSLQGSSVASWEGLPPAPRPGAAPPAPRGSLKVVTTNLQPGYLRKNGVPYSEKALVSEYWDVVKEADGVEWLIVQTVVDDPAYLTQPFITSTHFKRQKDASGWAPAPCLAR
jgi:hypothetical protein